MKAYQKTILKLRISILITTISIHILCGLNKYQNYFKIKDLDINYQYTKVFSPPGKLTLCGLKEYHKNNFKPNV